MTEEIRLAAAAALRALNNAFVAHEASTELLDRIAVVGGQITAELRSAERRDLASLLDAHVGEMFRVDRADESHRSGVNPMTYRAVGGPNNPISAELAFRYAENEVVVRTVLGAAYEGAPGRAHGGMVAALFDDITGLLLPLAGTAAYTGRLSVSYHRPVPVETLLEFRTRIERHEGRKLHVTADCRSGDEILATAEVLFITVDVRDFGRSTEIDPDEDLQPDR